LLAEVVKEGRSAKEPPESSLIELGIQIRQNLWSHWSEFRAIYAHLLGMEDVSEARLRKTWRVVYRSFCKFRFGRWQEAAQRHAMTSSPRHAHPCGRTDL
jgi:hypothetical protein